VLSKYCAAIFVNGCFWHGHNCSLFRLPATRREFWQEKIDKNRHNDRRSIAALQLAGWRIATIWECSMRGPLRRDEVDLADRLSFWLHGENGNLDISEMKAGEK
jgi:DNA mismatch endonuclease (patch repair protein)